MRFSHYRLRHELIALTDMSQVGQITGWIDNNPVTVNRGWLSPTKLSRKLRVAFWNCAERSIVTESSFESLPDLLRDQLKGIEWQILCPRPALESLGMAAE